MIKAAVSNPYAVFVCSAIAVMFGIIAMLTIPVQLKPVIEPPEIRISTYYWGASPLEVEDQITNKIEQEVSSINDLKRVSSNSQEGVSTVSLIFVDDADKNKALIDTVQALKRVTDLPDLATEPEVELVTGTQGDEIMWLDVKGGASVNEKYDVIDQTVQPFLLRVQGVGRVQFFGGTERKIIVQPDPERLAQHMITLGQLGMAIAAENLNARGGYLDEGDRQYLVRTLGKYESLDDVRNTVVIHNENGTVTVGDVATVIDGRDRQIGYVHVNGLPSIAMGVNRQSGANTVTTIRALNQEIDSFNQRFKESGLDMELEQVYSELPYVEDAIGLVRDNLLLGAFLAAIILALFLRAGRPIIIVLTTVPVSLITVFIVLQALGRTINIISLAGIAFSVGMVIDNAIVVMENIDRHMRELGKPSLRAAYDGITEISGAVFASMMTNVIVFIPVVLNTTEAGLLFKDIAIAIVSANVVALFAGYAIVPSMAGLLMRVGSLRERLMKDNPKLSQTLDLIEFQWVGHLMGRLYQNFLNWLCDREGRGRTLGRTVFLMAIAGFFAFSMWLLPAANYLPNGTREFIFCIAQPNVGTRNDVAMNLLKPVEDFAQSDPRINGTFAVSAQPFFTGVGVVVDRKQSNDKNLNDLVAKIGEIGFQIPGFRFFIPMRASIFQVRDKEFTIEVTGPELSTLKRTSDALVAQLFGKPEIVQFARTAYTEGVPEIAVHLDRYRMAQQGLNLRDVAMGVEMMLGGRDVSKFSEKGREYDLMIKGDPLTVTDRDKLGALNFFTPTGRVIRLDEIAKLEETTGPSAIGHVNRQRSIEVTVNTVPTLPTQTALDLVTKDVVEPMQSTLPSGYSIRFGDAADKLRDTLKSLAIQGLLAIAIVYLLMVALFRSFRYPLVILVTIPLAWSGSFLGVSLAYRLSGGVAQFDVLGMLGLIILTGIVVNNAILIVHQTINYEREGLAPLDALKESARTRLRPIWMSVLTAAFGILPLALGRGSGSELYKGLGVVMLGGQLVSTVFTLYVVPVIVSFIQDAQERSNLRRYGQLESKAPQSLD